MNLTLGLYGLVLLGIALVLIIVLWVRRRVAGAYDLAADAPPDWRRGERILAAAAGIATIGGIILSLLGAV
jgi:hypothetical protein